MPRWRVSLSDRCRRELVSDRGVMGKAAKGATRRKAGQGRPAARRHQFRATAATAASKAEKIVLPGGIATADAFRIVAGSVLRQIISNQPAVQAGNPDGVHQMRIGLRRMRAAISIFTELLQDAETDRLKRELRWLTGRLGPARDLHLLAGKSGGRGRAIRRVCAGSPTSKRAATWRLPAPGARSPRRAIAPCCAIWRNGSRPASGRQRRCPTTVVATPQVLPSRWLRSARARCCGGRPNCAN
jgi:hypothetical protein